MLLTVSTTHAPATDLGYLLHKNPARPQSKTLAFGEAIVFYPQAGPQQCTAALMVDVDPIELIRGRGRGSRGAPSPVFALGQYVNDRPYAAGSFLSVAIAQVYGSALGGRSKERPELAQTAIPLTAVVYSLPARGGEPLLRGLFEPLGYNVALERLPLDPQFPQWGDGRYFNLTLSATTRLSALLEHLYVLIPVLDDQKHYYVGSDELEKLLRHGEGWLATHPLRDEITRRYLRRQPSLVREALARLSADDLLSEEEPAKDAAEQALEAPLPQPGGVPVHQQRISTAAETLKARGCLRVVDLGCGEGRLLRTLLGERQFERVCGVDVSPRALEIAEARLRPERMAEATRARLSLAQSALTYRDRRLEAGGELAGEGGFDGAALVEVIEHIEPPRLPALERVVFGYIKPRIIVITTPNAEYNALLPTLPAGQLRHRDHRFEWTRDQFQAWCSSAGERYGYAFTIAGVGPSDAAVGALSQMAVFEQAEVTR